MRLARVLFAAILLALPAAAQEADYPGLETGKMWTFDQPPLDYWFKRYGFRPDSQWLAHVRLSAARLPGCSASFVSAEGLVLTNHHCARSCIQAATREGEDLLANGFYAARREDERPCPAVTVDRLLGIADVTDSVNAAVPADAPAARSAALRGERIRAIERACAAAATGLHCQVISMYRGGQYRLYTFRRYTDARLVFAPEAGIAFFGGDPDNFTYPRHDLDVAFYRVYEDGRPLAAEHHFRWTRAGVDEGDLVFLVGNPGSTGRLLTLAQLELLRDHQYPFQLDQLARQIAVYQEVAALSGERARAVRNTLFGLQNSQKAITGYRVGLTDPDQMTRKRAWEERFRAAVRADSALARRYGTAWDELAGINRELAALDARRRLYGLDAFGARLLGFAGMIVRYAAETAKPDSARLAAFRDANRAQFERTLYEAPPVDTAVERRLIAAWLSALERWLPADDPVRRAALGNRAPEGAAAAMLAGSALLTAAARRTLVAGGEVAVASSTDPFVRLARVIDPLERELTRRVNDLLEREGRETERIARALFAVYGAAVAPDATFSLRISDGIVRRYPAGGTFAPPLTTFHGLYDRSRGFGGREPWALPQRWRERRDSLQLETPLNGVSTADGIGGNSGSPVVSRGGELVGVHFDSNVEKLPGRFLYTEARGRSIWVDARGILEALRKVYDAGPLAAELARR